MNRILIVEDDRNLSQSLIHFLVREGFRVDWAGSLAEAELKLSEMPDVIVLDWMLPDGHGVHWIPRLREQKLGVPVILLTARAELADRILGLESGSNDYVVKPFEPKELLARIRVQIRQKKGDQLLKATSHAGVNLDPASRSVTYHDQSVELTRMEFELLRVLISSPGKVFSREELLNRVWGYENFTTTRTLDTHVLQLRQKFSNELIETVRGVGYRMRGVR